MKNAAAPQAAIHSLLLIKIDTPSIRSIYGGVIEFVMNEKPVIVL